MWYEIAFNYTDSCTGQNPYAGVLNSPFIVQYDKCTFNKRLSLGTLQLQNLCSLLMFFDGYGRINSVTLWREDKLLWCAAHQMYLSSL